MVKNTFLLFIIFLSYSFCHAQNKDFKHGKNLELFFNSYNRALTNYVDTINSDLGTKKAIEALFSTFDPYTEYYDEKETLEFEISTTGKYGGVGSIIRQHYQDSLYIQIVEPYKNSPSDKAGLRPGDKVLIVDGVDMRGKQVEEVSNAMKGDPGTIVNMIVAPIRDTTKRKNINIKRERISVPAVRYYSLLNDSIGYILLSSFTENCSNEVEKAIKDLDTKGMKSLILDLRSNGGGRLDEAVKVMSLFVPKDSEIVTIKGRNKNNDIVYKTHNTPIVPTLPLVVMVNRSSASASEIVAGAIQDLDRGVVIGERTFGKGLVQSVMDVGYGASIKITTAKYYIPSGRCIQALDYTHLNEDGSVGKIADSLISEFKTKNGRKVFDGGGILPDTIVPAKEVGRFAAFVYMTGYSDNFALDYYSRHLETPDIETFALTDKDWNDFKKMLKSEKLDYSFESEGNLKKLVHSAKAEGYYDDIKGLITQIETTIKSDTDKHLEFNRKEITMYIERAIIINYLYAEGGVKLMLKHDKSLSIAKSIATNKKSYNSILSENN